MKDWYHFLLSLVFLISCSTQTDPAPKSDDTAGTTLPLVTDARTDLVLSWFADAGAGVGSLVKDVPMDARNEVRVQDPTIPPEQRDPKWIFLADLTKKDENGTYSVHKELRANYEAKRLKIAASNATIPDSIVTPTISSSAPSGSAPITMYTTRHCPVCHKARRWLLEQRVPYVERDLETDPKAAMELAQKGKAQGVPTNGVPIFDVRGQLVPGFDPATIVKLLGTNPRPI